VLADEAEIVSCTGVSNQRIDRHRMLNYLLLCCQTKALEHAVNGFLWVDRETVT